MTKEEAIQALKDHKAVTHRYFTDDEYIVIKENGLQDEKGIKLNWIEFWSYRTDKMFDDGWEIYEIK